MKPGEVLLDTYQIEHILGRGGMGEVASALHLRLGERVAIKVLREEKGGAQQPKIRLSREAQAAARLRGEHTIRVFDLRELPGGEPIIVMEFIEGGSLADLLRERGPLPLEEALDDVLQAAEGLAEAHAQGIVHRDIKPANLLRTQRPDGSPLIKVSDFGLATTGTLERITGSDVTLGSPPYMSPEQIRTPHAVDARSDVWSLAVVLYELCTGALPWSGYTSAGILASIAADQPIPARSRRADLPTRLDEALLAALEKQPSSRVSDVGAFARLLAPLLPGGADRATRIERILRAPPRSLSNESPPGDTTPTESGAGQNTESPARTEAAHASTEASVLALSSPNTPEPAPKEVTATPNNRAARWGLLGGLALLPLLFVLRSATQASAPPQAALSAAPPPSENASTPPLAPENPPPAASSASASAAFTSAPQAALPHPPAPPFSASPRATFHAPPSALSAQTPPAQTPPQPSPSPQPSPPRHIDPLDQLGPRK